MRHVVQRDPLHCTIFTCFALSTLQGKRGDQLITKESYTGHVDFLKEFLHHCYELFRSWFFTKFVLTFEVLLSRFFLCYIFHVIFFLKIKLCLFRFQSFISFQPQYNSPLVTWPPNVVLRTSYRMYLFCRLYKYLGDIIVHKCVCKHRCTLSSLTLLIRWDGNPTQPGRDPAQDQQLYMLSEARGCHTTKF